MEFSCNRFCHLIRIHAAEHYLPVALAVLALATLFGCINYAMITPDQPQNIVGIIALFLVVFFLGFMLVSCASTLFAARAFLDYHDKNKATAAFMIPASLAEKFLARYAIYVLLMPFLFQGAFLAIEISAFAAVLDIPKYFLPIDGELKAVQDVNAFILQPKNIFTLWLHTATFQALYFLGAILFKSKPFLKTSLILGVATGFALPKLSKLTESLSNALFSTTPNSAANFSNLSISLSIAAFLILSGAAWIAFKFKKLS